MPCCVTNVASNVACPAVTDRFCHPEPAQQWEATSQNCCADGAVQGLGMHLQGVCSYRPQSDFVLHCYRAASLKLGLRA